MARGNYEDRVLQDAINDARLSDEQEQALGNFIHQGNSPEPRGDYRAAAAFIRDFFNTYSWRQYIKM